MSEPSPSLPGSLLMERRSVRIALVMLFLIALIPRWTRLGRESLWFDEGWTWWLVTQPAGQMFRLMRADTVAPLYFYLLHAWTRLFGDGSYALRGMSAMFATLAVVPWLALARRTFVTKSALLAAAALVATSFMQEQYSREARPYALMGLVTLGALCCVPTLANKRSWPAMGGFALGVVAGMYTHNTMALYAASLALAWLVWPGERPLKLRLPDLAIVVAICVVAYLPWVPTLREQARWVGSNFWAARPGFFEANLVTSAVCGIDVYGVSPILWVIFGRSPGAEGVGVITTVAIVASIVLACCTHDSVARRKTLAIAIVAFVPVITVFTISRLGKPIFFPRVFIPTSLLTPILFAMPLDRSRGVRVAGLVIAGLLFIGGAISVVIDLKYLQKDDWAGAYSYVTHLPPSSKRLLVFVAAEGELPYAHRVALDPTRVTEPRTGVPQGFFDLDPPRTMQRIPSAASLDALARKLSDGTFDEVILVLSHQTHVDPSGLTKAWFDREWMQVDDIKFRNVRLVRYRPRT